MTLAICTSHATPKIWCQGLQDAMARPEVGASGGHGRDYNARAQYTLRRHCPSRDCARQIATISFLHSRTDLDDTLFHFLQFLTWIRLISYWARASQALYITERSYTGGEDTRFTFSAAKVIGMAVSWIARRDTRRYTDGKYIRLTFSVVHLGGRHKAFA
jgi:hypothetical protein